jgi:ubiquinone/menaquinone biosynthesis C-methylase UbiE
LAPESNDYILGVNEDERTRLLAQAELHAPEARVLLDRVGVAPGWRTIDVGCGPLGVLDLLAERVGPTGTVVGLDRDERMLAMPLSRWPSASCTTCVSCKPQPTRP